MTFTALVTTMKRTTHICDLARIINPKVDTLDIKELGLDEWNALYALFDHKYPDEVFLEKFWDTPGMQKLTLRPGDTSHAEASRFGRHSTTVIGDRRVCLVFSASDSSMDIAGVIF